MTVEMLLIFNFGRPDILPIMILGSGRDFKLHIKRGITNTKTIERFGRKWKTYRTMATLYLWRAVDFVNLEGW